LRHPAVGESRFPWPERLLPPACTSAQDLRRLRGRCIGESVLLQRVAGSTCRWQRGNDEQRTDERNHAAGSRLRLVLTWRYAQRVTRATGWSPTTASRRAPARWASA